MDDYIQRALDEAFPPQPATVDWSMALSVYTLRELESRMPGFRDGVRERVLRGSETTEGDNPTETTELRASLKELADSWVFED